MECVRLYKAQVLSYIEYRTPALYHACDSVLGRLDGVQRAFLRELGISDEDALCDFNLGPLRMRRDLAMLGMIHRAVLGQGPPHFRSIFILYPGSGRTSGRRRLHNKQLEDPRKGAFSEQLRRSALGLVAIYNLLPQDAVDLPSVSAFQAFLQNLANVAACVGRPGWDSFFSPRTPLYRHPLNTWLA